MPGKYPTGGYRTVEAREHSNTAQGNTPSVASSDLGPASGQYKPAPLKGELLVPDRPRYKREKLSEMGTKGQAGHGKVHLDRLDHIADSTDIGGSLDWKQREKFRMKHTIDLGPGDYKVDGRGRAMRAAIRLARGLIRGGKRLPKHAFKELVLTLLDAILSQIGQQYWPEEMQSDVMTAPAPWVYRSYGIEAGPAGVPAAIGEAAVPIVNPPRNGLLLNSTIYDPLQYGVGPQPAYSAPIGGQSVTLQAPLTVRAGIWRRELSTSRFSHVASWRAPASNTVPFKLSRLTSKFWYSTGNLNAPFTSTQTAAGSAAPNPLKVAVKAKDHKMSAPYWMNGALSVAYAATEFGDSIDCFYKALPKSERYGRSYSDKMQRVYAAFEKVDWTKAVECLMWNQVTDPLFGRGFGWLDKTFQSKSINGMSYQYGVTYGGGSASYIEVSL